VQGETRGRFGGSEGPHSPGSGVQEAGGGNHPIQVRVYFSSSRAPLLFVGSLKAVFPSRREERRDSADYISVSAQKYSQPRSTLSEMEVLDVEVEENL